LTKSSIKTSIGFPINISTETPIFLIANTNALPDEVRKAVHRIQKKGLTRRRQIEEREETISTRCKIKMLLLAILIRITTKIRFRIMEVRRCQTYRYTATHHHISDQNIHRIIPLPNPPDNLQPTVQVSMIDVRGVEAGEILVPVLRGTIQIVRPGEL